MQEGHEDHAILRQDAGGFVIELDEAVYHLSALKKAAYKFTDRLFVSITRGASEDQRIRVVLTPKDGRSDPKRMAGEFCNEVLDQELRETIAAETEAVCNLLLAHAFSKTSLIEPSLDCVDFRTDPQGIGQSANPPPHQVE